MRFIKFRNGQGAEAMLNDLLKLIKVEDLTSAQRKKLEDIFRKRQRELQKALEAMEQAINRLE
jgi:Spy/CpxP family protein refolding chaperone